MASRFPVVTFALALAILAVAWFVTGIFPTESSLRGVAWSRDAWAAGDWGALVVSTFAHGGPMHLLFNLFALASFGPIVERALGPTKFLALYLGAGVAGNFAHALFAVDVPVVGASGAIFGILGVLLVLAPLAEVAVFGVIPMPILLASSLYVASVPLLTTLSAALPVAHEAHLGGLAAGLLAGVAFRPARALRILPAGAAVFVAVWVGVAYVLALDYGALLDADVLGLARLLWPLAASVAVVGAAFAYLARLGAAGERDAGA